MLDSLVRCVAIFLMVDSTSSNLMPWIAPEAPVIPMTNFIDCEISPQPLETLLLQP